jgi:hypothetical protein
MASIATGMASPASDGHSAERLRRQRLTGAPLGAPEDVVAWFGAVQAQEYPVTRWSLGERATGLVEGDVDRALADGRIVRTHVMRDTWHLVAAADARWLLRLTGPRIAQRNRTMERKLGVDAGLLDRAATLLADELAGGVTRTREELAARLAAEGVPAPSGPRLAYLVMHAELEAVICSGGLRGKKHTYALADDRLPAGPPLEGDAALAELARRYLASHGPATARDLAWWSSLTVTSARQAIALLGDEAEPVQDGERELIRLRAPAPAARPDPPRAHLLGPYDEVGVAYRESRDVLDRAGLVTEPPGSSFTHLLLVDGRLAGFWRRRQRARSTDMEVRLLRPLDADEREAVDAAAERYAAFTGVPAAWAPAG